MDSMCIGNREQKVKKNEKISKDMIEALGKRGIDSGIIKCERGDR